MPTPDVTSTERSPARARARKRSRWIGRVIGHYQLVRRLGRGGMATVFEARHRLLGHRAAIKVLHPQHRDERSLVRRFCNEARVVASIEHPGIVRYQDIGRTADGHAYLIMELLAGESLADLLDRGPLSEAQAVAIGRRVASALAAAHARGIVHRDVKPENVFLVPDPEVPGGERVKVLDFGVAKVTHRADTAPGIIVGTPAYMAPEQCRPSDGDSRIIDGRTDVYGLGALLYRMVAGRPVFESQNDIGLMCRQVHDAPPPLRELGVSVSPGFEAMIERCLAKEPDDRYVSMAVLGKVLSGLEAAAVAHHQKPTALISAQADPDALPVRWEPDPAGSHGAWSELDSVPGYALAEPGAGPRPSSAPMHPLQDPSPPGGVMADGTSPPGAWEQSVARRMSAQPRDDSLAGDITILRHGLDRIDLTHVPVQMLAHPGDNRHRIWGAIGGFTIGWLVVAVLSLFL